MWVNMNSITGCPKQLNQSLGRILVGEEVKVMSADCKGIIANRGDEGRPIILECRLPRSE